MIISILGIVGEMERSQIRERQLEGIMENPRKLTPSLRSKLTPFGQFKLTP